MNDCKYIIKGPVYKHDCNFCTYLGTYTNDLSKHPYDYYFCKYPNSRSPGSCLARYGNEYWEYESMPVHSMKHWDEYVDNEKTLDAVTETPLYYCYSLAKGRGLVHE